MTIPGLMLHKSIANMIEWYTGVKITEDFTSFRSDILDVQPSRCLIACVFLISSGEEGFRWYRTYYCLLEKAKNFTSLCGMIGILLYGCRSRSRKRFSVTAANVAKAFKSVAIGGRVRPTFSAVILAWLWNAA